MSNENQANEAASPSQSWTTAQSEYMLRMLRKHERYYDNSLDKLEHCICGAWNAKNQEPWLQHVMTDIEQGWPQ